MNFLTYKFWLLILIGMLVSTQTLAAVLSSQVDRNAIGINETITLRVIYDEQVDSSLLDLRSLSTDFEIISNRPQSSSSVIINNGKTESTANTTWDIVLVPKREGKLIIPALSIDKATSSAIVIDVSASSASPVSDAPLSALISANNDEIYPNQQLIIEIELTASAAVRDLTGEQIEIVGADLELLDQQSFQRNSNGVINQVVVVTYALFAKEAGTVNIPALTFNGIEGGSRSIFSRRSSGKRVIARTEPLQITVKPAEQKDNQAWFTASNVVISSQWSADKAQAKIGEPLTRTIRILATEQRASAIPPLKADAVSDNYKAYADQPRLEDQKSEKGFTGIRTESEAIVPSKSGSITLPEKRISWWNSKTKRWDQAILPAETLEVSANSEVASNFNNISSQNETAQAVIEAKSQQPQSLSFWKLATLFLAVVTVLQFIMLLKLASNNATKPSVKTASKLSDAKRWQELQSAIKSGSAESTRQAILNWVGVAMHDRGITSLHALGQIEDAAELKPYLQKLDEQLYKDGKGLDLAALSDALRAFKNRVEQGANSTQSNAGDLAPLYPQ